MVRWAAPTAVVLVAALLRIYDLGGVLGLTFDETYYVKDAYSLWTQGYEGVWAPGADWMIRIGHWDGLSTDPEFVAHPPLGKWAIALGLFGGGIEQAWSPRIASAVAGILVVVLTIAIGRRLTGSLAWGTIAGWFVAIDGLAITMSRLAMLDIFLLLFTMLGVWAMLRDTARPRGLWWRPWLLVAGASFGAAISVKWSGIFYLAAFGLWVSVVDVLQRHRRGESRSWWGSGWRHALVDAAHLLPVAGGVYIASWTGWFATQSGWAQRWADTSGNAWGGPFAWIPPVIQVWVQEQISMFRSDTAFDLELGQQSSPFTWPFWLHPSHSWNLQLNPGSDQTCSASSCGLLVVDLPNPLLWVAGLIAVLVLLVTLWRRRSWREGAVLTAVAAGYLPWFLFSRTSFAYYVIEFLPFVYLALVLVLQRIVRHRPESLRWWWGARIGTLAFVVLATLVSAWFLPVWIGIWIPVAWMRTLLWMPGWTWSTYLDTNLTGLDY